MSGRRGDITGGGTNGQKRCYTLGRTGRLYWLYLGGEQGGYTGLGTTCLYTSLGIPSYYTSLGIHHPATPPVTVLHSWCAQRGAGEKRLWALRLRVAWVGGDSA